MKKSFLILVGLLIASVAVNVWLAVRGPKVETTIETKTDTLWKDTMIEKPLPAETINTGRVVYIRVPIQRDTLRDTIRDSIDVPVPIMQKRYDDSLYTAWVSGFEPNLDSINLRLPTITETVTTTNTIIKPFSRFSVGIQAGAGCGIFSHQPDLFLGVGLQYRLWPK